MEIYDTNLFQKFFIWFSSFDIRNQAWSKTACPSNTAKMQSNKLHLYDVLFYWI